MKESGTLAILTNPSQIPTLDSYVRVAVPRQRRSKWG
jgi:hypothetical protein